MSYSNRAEGLAHTVSSSAAAVLCSDAWYPFFPHMSRNLAYSPYDISVPNSQF